MHAKKYYMHVRFSTGQQPFNSRSSLNHIRNCSRMETRIIYTHALGLERYGHVGEVSQSPNLSE